MPSATLINQVCSSPPGVNDSALTEEILTKRPSYSISPISTYSPHVSHVVRHGSIFLPKAFSVIRWKLLLIMLSKTSKKNPTLIYLCFFGKPEGKLSELFFFLHRFLVLTFPKITIIAIKTPLQYSIFFLKPHDLVCHFLTILSMTLLTGKYLEMMQIVFLCFIALANYDVVRHLDKYTYFIYFPTY